MSRCLPPALSVGTEITAETPQKASTDLQAAAIVGINYRVRPTPEDLA
jgi:hypothetical protein